MIDFYRMFAQMQVTGSLPYQQSGSGGNTAAKSDGSGDGAFAKIFQRASGGGNTGQTCSGPKAEEAAVPAETTEITEPDENAAALAGAAIIQDRQIETPPDQGGQQQVVSILEGNKDIGTQAPVSEPNQGEAADDALAFVTQQAEGTGEELTARMPRQAPGQVREAKGSENPGAPVENAVSEEAEGPCPLENKSDSPQTGSSMKQEEGTEDEPPAEDGSRVFAAQQQVDITPERIAGTERLAAAANTAPQAAATPQTLFDTMVQNIALSSANGTSYMEIQLKPEFLGKVAIQMALSDSGLEIKIKSDDMNIRGLIAGQIAQLSESLSDKGVKVTSIDVIYSEVSEHAFGESGPKNGQHYQEQVYGSGQPANLGFGIGFTEDADELSMMDAGISSVEYRA